MVVQKKDWFGLKSGRIGWVTDVWPKTRILFTDGSEHYALYEFKKILEVTDEYEQDIDSLRERIGPFAGYGARIKRKT